MLQINLRQHSVTLDSSVRPELWRRAVDEIIALLEDGREVGEHFTMEVLDAREANLREGVSQRTEN